MTLYESIFLQYILRQADPAQLNQAADAIIQHFGGLLEYSNFIRAPNMEGISQIINIFELQEIKLVDTNILIGLDYGTFTQIAKYLDVVSSHWMSCCCLKSYWMMHRVYTGSEIKLALSEKDTFILRGIIHQAPANTLFNAFRVSNHSEHFILSVCMGYFARNMMYKELQTIIADNMVYKKYFIKYYSASMSALYHAPQPTLTTRHRDCPLLAISNKSKHGALKPLFDVVFSTDPTILVHNLDSIISLLSVPINKLYSKEIQTNDLKIILRTGMFKHVLQRLDNEAICNELKKRFLLLLYRYAKSTKTDMKYLEISSIMAYSVSIIKFAIDSMDREFELNIFDFILDCVQNTEDKIYEELMPLFFFCTHRITASRDLSITPSSAHLLSKIAANITTSFSSDSLQIVLNKMMDKMHPTINQNEFIILSHGILYFLDANYDKLLDLDISLEPLSKIQSLSPLHCKETSSMILKIINAMHKKHHQCNAMHYNDILTRAKTVLPLWRIPFDFI